jgi:hypothetical protein
MAAPNHGLSALPGLSGMTRPTVMAEFDPSKCSSFATNAGAQVHRVTTDIDRCLPVPAGPPHKIAGFSPVRVLKSTIDATVTIDAVVHNLLKRLFSRFSLFVGMWHDR